MKSSVWVVTLAICGAAACMAAENTGSAPAPEAPKAAPPVTSKIYGQVNISGDLLDARGDGKKAREYLSSNSSRIGFKGDWALAEAAGLKAVWQMEAGVAVDERDNNDFFSSRNTFAGIGCDYGTVFAGRHDTPFKCISRDTDLFGDQIGDTRNLTMPGGNKWDQRPDNTVAYRSPEFNGVTLFAARVFGDEEEDNYINSANVTWKGLEEKVYLGAAYEIHGDMRTGADTNEDAVVDMPSDEQESGVRVGAGVKLGIVSLKALAQKLMDVGGVKGNDSDVFGGGVAVKLGKETIKGQYYVRDDEGSGKGAAITAAGYEHAFNDKCLIYVDLALTDNESGSKYTMSGEGHGDSLVPPVGEAVQGGSVGMIYKF